jgi:hypothetical protein
MVGFLTACSGLKTYNSNLENNLQISTETDSGSVFSSMRTTVDVHTVNPDCTIEYAGTVKLDDRSEEIGIPTGRSTYLVFVYEKGGFLSSTETSMTYETLIRPRAGYQYSAKVTYEDSLYNVVLNETRPGSKKKRAIATRGMHTCRPV